MILFFLVGLNLLDKRVDVEVMDPLSLIASISSFLLTWISDSFIRELSSLSIRSESSKVPNIEYCLKEMMIIPHISISCHTITVIIFNITHSNMVYFRVRQNIIRFLKFIPVMGHTLNALTLLRVSGIRDSIFGRLGHLAAAGRSSLTVLISKLRFAY